MKTNILKISFYSLFYSLFIFSLFASSFTFVQAQTTPAWIPCNGVVINGVGKECTFADLITGVNAVVGWMIKTGLIVSALVFAWAGWLMIEGSDNPNQIKRAKQMMLDVLIGLVIMLSAWLIINLVLTALTNGNIYNPLKK